MCCLAASQSQHRCALKLLSVVRLEAYARSSGFRFESLLVGRQQPTQLVADLCLAMSRLKHSHTCCSRTPAYRCEGARVSKYAVAGSCRCRGRRSAVCCCCSSGRGSVGVHGLHISREDQSLVGSLPPLLGGPAGPHQVRIEQGFGHSAACQGGGVPVGGAWPFTRLDFPGRPARNACSRALRDIPSRESFQLWCTCCVSPSRPTCDLLRSNPLYVARGQANRCYNR